MRWNGHRWQVIKWQVIKLPAHLVPVRQVPRPSHTLAESLTNAPRGGAHQPIRPTGRDLDGPGGVKSRRYQTGSGHLTLLLNIIVSQEKDASNPSSVTALSNHSITM